MIKSIHSPSEFRQVVSSKVAQWKELDGTSTDQDSRPDFVEIQSQGSVVQAFVSSKTLIELTRDESGNTTIAEFDRPRFCHAGGAKEVYRKSSGEFSGIELTYNNNGAIWPGVGFSFMQGMWVDPSDAKNTFLIADARMSRPVFTGDNCG
jgi:hypothetical protein